MNDREKQIMRSLMSFEYHTLPSMRGARPMDLGGSDASHHSATLQRMEKKGWIKNVGYKCNSRRVNLYRSTEAGRAAVSEVVAP